MNRRLDIIDYLKGYSIFTIVLYHLISFFKLYNWGSLIKTASNFGGAGVHIFILCSGFGLYLSYIKNPITFINFLKKRFSRVYIPYIIVVGISSLIPIMYTGNRIMALLSHADCRQSDSRKQVLESFLFY